MYISICFIGIYKYTKVYLTCELNEIYGISCIPIKCVNIGIDNYLNI